MRSRAMAMCATATGDGPIKLISAGGHTRVSWQISAPPRFAPSAGLSVAQQSPAMGTASQVVSTPRLRASGLGLRSLLITEAGFALDRRDALFKGLKSAFRRGAAEIGTPRSDLRPGATVERAANEDHDCEDQNPHTHGRYIGTTPSACTGFPPTGIAKIAAAEFEIPLAAVTIVRNAGIARGRHPCAMSSRRVL
jgi:hypothetical protein